MNPRRLRPPSACWLLLLLIVCGGGGGAVSARAADFRELYRAALAHEHRRSWAEAEEFYERALAETAPDRIAADRRDPSPDVVRRRCLLWLAANARRFQRQREALDYALRYRAELEALPARPGRDVRPWLRQVEQEIAEDHLALGDLPQARDTFEGLLVGRYGPLQDFPRLECLIRLAVVDELSGRVDAAQQRWSQALDLGQAIFERPETQRFAVDRGLCARQLALCYEGLGDRAKSDGMIADLLNSLDPPRKREALIELAMHSMLREHHQRAETFFRQALASVPLADVRGRADLTRMIAATLSRQDQPDAANRHWQLAASLYEQAAADAGSDSARTAADQDAVGTAAAALRQLRTIYLQMGRLSDAVRVGERLFEVERARLGNDHALTVDAGLSLGSLYAAEGQLTQARPLLEQAVAWSRSRPDADPRDLARALNGLGHVEHMVGRLVSAAGCFEEALAIRERHLPPEDPELAVSYNNLASVHLARGDFRGAIHLWRKVLDRCRDRGRAANALCATVLLNLAAAYRSQGQHDEAVEYARESLQLREQEFGTDALELVSHLNLLSQLSRERLNFATAHAWADRALRLCETHNAADGLDAADVRGNLGMICYLEQAYESAASHWQAALETYRRHGRHARAARMLNMLGVLAYRRDQLAAARRCFEEADAIFSEIGAPPLDGYNTRSNLAGVLIAEGRRAEAITTLEAAIELIETPRAGVSGSEQERAEFFGQTASAFDALVDLSFEAGQPDRAFRAAERGRNRTFLDQLRLAGADLQQTLPDGPASRSLLVREQDLLARVSELRQRLHVLAAPEEQDTLRLDELANELAAAEDEFRRTWTEIRNRSPVYNGLLAQGSRLVALDDIRRNALGPDGLMLFYYLGARRSWLLVADGGSRPPEWFELAVSADLARRLSELIPPGDEESRGSERALGEPVQTKLGEPLIDRGVPTSVPAGPLTRETAAVLVSWYREVLRDPAFGATRGLGEPVRTKLGRPLAEPATALADVLLPAAVQQIIAERPPGVLVIVPDGSLHNLPFEALLLEDGPRPEFVLDRFPPIAYAPSANILSALRNRPPASPAARARLLTAGDPAYPQAAIASVDAVPAMLTREALLEPAGHLPALPATARECRRIAAAFSRSGGDVALALGRDATEAGVTAGIAGRGFVHLAVHGLVDESPGNLFGALALARPASSVPRPDDDGLLTYAEILQLPLGDCELAVLSACETNVGPFRPLEAGSTLAQAFLAAGSRRVVASHWKVSDESTAELMAAFFEQLAEPLARGEAVDYAAALHAARSRLRNDTAHPEWSSPYSWAPFVLLGPIRERRLDSLQQ